MENNKIIKMKAKGFTYIGDKENFDYREKISVQDMDGYKYYTTYDFFVQKFK